MWEFHAPGGELIPVGTDHILYNAPWGVPCLDGITWCTPTGSDWPGMPAGRRSGGYVDTGWDLVFDLVGATLVAVWLVINRGAARRPSQAGETT